MKKSIKASLLSALVFPGLGHLFLKKYIPGITLSGTALAAVYIIITKTVERAMQIADKLQSGEIPADASVITDLVTKQSQGAETQTLNIATVILLIVWLIGIVDAFRAGRTYDKGAQN